MAGQPKHGFSYDPEYRAWQTMRLRCHNPSNRAYPDYGGRGIKVCQRWIESVENFMADMGRKPGPEFEIDRIDNDGDYEPANCRWVTRKQNDRNRRSTFKVNYQGREVPLIDLCERHGIRPDTARSRLRHGWEIEDVLSVPTRKKAPNGLAKSK